MSIIITYNTIKTFVEEQGSSTLVSTQEEFDKELIKQGKTPNYVKLTYRCRCGAIFTRDFAGMKSGTGLCTPCSKIKSQQVRRLNTQKQQTLIANKGLEFVEGDIKNHDTKFLVKCCCGNTFETTLRIIKNSVLPTMMCKECHKKKCSERLRTPFSEIEKLLEANGCKIISGEEEYRNNNSNITFLARCGHVHTTSVAVIKNIMKHFVCSECKKKVNSSEKAYNWKGGTYNNESTKFRKTHEFKRWRKLVFERDKYTCQCCKQKGNRLNAHHLDGYNWCVEKRTDVDNGVTLCVNCHNEFHKLYGRGDNTKEQFEEYLSNKQIS